MKSPSGRPLFGSPQKCRCRLLLLIPKPGSSSEETHVPPSPIHTLPTSGTRPGAALPAAAASPGLRLPRLLCLPQLQRVPGRSLAGGVPFPSHFAGCASPPFL